MPFGLRCAGTAGAGCAESLGCGPLAYTAPSRAAHGRAVLRRELDLVPAGAEGRQGGTRMNCVKAASRSNEKERGKRFFKLKEIKNAVTLESREDLRGEQNSAVSLEHTVL